MILAALLDPTFVLPFPGGLAARPIDPRGPARTVTVDPNGTGRVWQGRKALRLVGAFQLPSARAGAEDNASPEGYITIVNRQGDRVLVLNADTRDVWAVALDPYRPLWKGHLDTYAAWDAAWAKDGRTLLAPIGDNPTASRVYGPDGKRHGTLPITPPYAFHGSLVYGFVKGGVAAYDLRARRVRLLREPRPAFPLRVSPDGRWLVVGSHDASGYRYRYAVWRLADGRRAGSFPGVGVAVNDAEDPVFAGGNRVEMRALKEVRALPSGRLVRNLPGHVPLGDLESESNARVFPRFEFLPVPIVHSYVWPRPDGSLLASGRTQRLLLDPRRRIARLVSTQNFPASGEKAFGPGGATYEGFSGPAGFLRRVRSGSLKPKGHFATQPSPSADGRFVSIVDDADPTYQRPRQTALLLEAATGTVVRRLPVRLVQDLALSPDGRTTALLQTTGLTLQPLDGAPGRFVRVRVPYGNGITWWDTDRVVVHGSGVESQSVNVRTGRVAASWAAWDDGAWVLWTPGGAVDGNPSGLARLYRVEGTRATPVRAASRRVEAWKALGPTAP